MKKTRIIHTVLNWLIATVWLLNGLVCKLLNIVPRHQLIVSRILGNEHVFLFTKAIGAAEVLMAIWILSSIQSRLSAVVQIVIVLTMNIIEFLLVPDLLLFGRINLFVAIAFCCVIYYNQFMLIKKQIQPS
jgi:hypothetical protein